jgi:tripartite-type tricarboxylate transporter receptor subunit TctC
MSTASTRRDFAKTLAASTAWLAAGGGTSAAAAAENSSTPVRLLVGLAPGGANDVGARLLAERLSEELGRPVYVDSKPGAGQRLALGDLRRAKPDGNTLMLATNSPFTIYPHIYTKLDYDPVKDFTPIAGVMSFDVGLAIGPMTPVPDLKHWIAWAKANPAQASFGTPGAGTLPHFLGVAFSQAIGVNMPMVPYKGGAPAMNDLAGGHLPLLINGLGDMTEMHHAGKIRLIAMTGPKRSPLAPEVPTLIESGIDVHSVITVGVFGPAGMSPELVSRLNGAITRSVNAPDTNAKFIKLGVNPAPATPQELASALAAESKRLAVLVKSSGYMADE